MTNLELIDYYLAEELLIFDEIIPDIADHTMILSDFAVIELDEDFKPIKVLKN